VKSWLKLRVPDGENAKSPAVAPPPAEDSTQLVVATTESELGNDVANIEGPSQPIGEDLELPNAPKEEFHPPAEVCSVSRHSQDVVLIRDIEPR
jgi:hypothetical protein